MRLVLRVLGLPLIALSLEGLSLALDDVDGIEAERLGSDLSFGFAPDPVFPEDEAYEEEEDE